MRPGDRAFGTETQPPGSAVSQGPGTVVIPPPPQSVVVQPSQTPVVVSPGQSVVVQPPQSGQPVVVQSGTVTVPASQIVQADGLEATEVRAQTIYANRIESRQIRGTIYPSGGVRMDRTVTNLKMETVTASVLYADTIKADRVIADQIFVREVERR